VVERGGSGIGVWDIRATGRRVQWLNGRRARTMQRLGVEFIGRSVYAGGTDGVIRFWEGVGMTEGVVEPGWELDAHGDPISSAVMHPCGSILATCSGQRRIPSAGSEDGDESDGSSSTCSSSEDWTDRCDNSLKVWCLG